MRHRYVWFYNRVSTIVVLITLIVATIPVQVNAVNSADYVTNEVLVKLKPLANVLNLLITYGLEPNIRTLDTFLRYSYEQGLSKRQLDAQELFAPETLESFKI